MRNVFRLLALVAVMMTVNTVFAHHSFGATYDTSKQVKIEGKLVQFVYRNPHSFVHIEAPDAEAWSSGGPSSGAARRNSPAPA